MRIIIDCYQYQPFITGTDRQARHFIEELQKIDSENMYELICSEYSFIPEIVKSNNFIIHRAPQIPGPSILRRVVIKIWKQWFYSRLSSNKPDVYFSFHNMQLPSRRVARKMILSNLDLIPIVLPDYFTITRLSKKQNETLYKQNAESADAIMSISEYSKTELCQLLSVNPQKVRVIPLAADLPKATSNIATINGVELPKNFMMTIGGAETRKNVEKVMKAHAMLSKEIQQKFPLVIVGNNWQDKQLSPQPFCSILGRITDDELSYLYRHTTLFVFASSYEGFGLPVLEAFSSGAATICSMGSSLDELCENKIPQFNPDDPEKLLELISNLLNDTEARKSLRNEVLKISEKYSWHKSAQLLHALLTTQ